MMTLRTAAREAMKYGYKTIINAAGERHPLTDAETSKQGRSRNWTMATALRIGNEKPFPALVKYTRNGSHFGYYKLGY